MTNFKVMTTERLRALLEDTQVTLNELRTELDRREQLEQHKEIEIIDQHIESAENSLVSIKEFFRYLLDNNSSSK